MPSSLPSSLSAFAELFPAELLNRETVANLQSVLSSQPELAHMSFGAVFTKQEVSPDLPLRAVSLQTSASSTTELVCAVLTGAVETGTKIRQLPDAYEATVVGVAEPDSETAGSHHVLTLDKPVPVKAGQLWMVSDQPATVGHQLEVCIFWLGDKPLLPGRTYRIYTAGGVKDATVTDIKYQSKPGSKEQLATKTLARHNMGVCNLSLSGDLAFDPASENPQTGSFLLSDKNGQTLLGIGGINFTLRRSDNITLQRLNINRDARSQLKGQKPCVVWLTGLSGSGKSTIANHLEQKLHALGKHTYMLDGDNVRHGLNKDLGFTDVDRVENIRRIAEVAKLMVDAGLIVVTAFISPFRAERKMARDLFADGDFIEVFVNTPLEVAEQRDVKGLYKKARSGQLKNFTGIDSPYEAPENAECEVRTDQMSAEEAASFLIAEVLSVS